VKQDLPSKSRFVIGGKSQLSLDIFLKPS